jgi:phage terminase large subunit-like protein
LFLALVIGAFLAARRDRWFLASILGALASLARVNGLLLLAALGAEVLHRWWSERRWRWRWLWIALIPAGFAIYLFLNYRVTGNAFTFAEYESSHWNQQLTWPWYTFIKTPADVYAHGAYDAQMTGWQIELYLTIGLAATLVSAFTLRPSYTVWMLTNWLLVACLTWDLSAPRYALALFPMFIIFARLARVRELGAIITFWSLLSMSLFAAYFVRGWWAF